jgi:hypothetical protein
MQTRYCVKWKSSEAKLVLKITDNTTVSPPPPSLFASGVRFNVSLGISRCPVLKFKTYSSVYLNRFEALNLTLMRKMQNRKRPDPSTSSIPVPADTGGILESRRRIISPNPTSSRWRRKEKEGEEEEIDAFPATIYVSTSCWRKVVITLDTVRSMFTHQHKSSRIQAP